MTSKTLKLKELEKKKLKEIFQTVLTNQLVLTVQLPDGEEVIIQPKPPLKQLPVLEGYVPEGWKQAIYRNSKSETKEKRTMSIGKKRKSNFGSAKGLIVMRDEFDQPIDDFKEYM